MRIRDRSIIFCIAGSLSDRTLSTACAGCGACKLINELRSIATSVIEQLVNDSDIDSDAAHPVRARDRASRSGRSSRRATVGSMKIHAALGNAPRIAALQ